VSAGFILLVLSSASATPVVAEDPRPLTNVDVVRMNARRVPREDILRAIREAPAVDFELDPDVVVELRRAGISEPIIEAMREAMRAAARRSPGSASPGPAAFDVPGSTVGDETPPSPEASPPGSGGVRTLILMFEGDPADEPMDRTAVYFRSGSAAPPSRGDAKNRPPATGDAPDPGVELGFIMICTTPTHVPDQWHARSPIGEGAMRHRVLWFHEETHPYRNGRRRDLVMLGLPREERVPLSGDPHTVLFGITARPGGETTATAISFSETALSIPAGGDVKITLAVATRNLRGLSSAPRGVTLHTFRVVRVEESAARTTPSGRGLPLSPPGRS